MAVESGAERRAGDARSAEARRRPRRALRLRRSRGLGARAGFVLPQRRATRATRLSPAPFASAPAGVRPSDTSAAAVTRGMTRAAGLSASDGSPSRRAAALAAATDCGGSAVPPSSFPAQGAARQQGRDLGEVGVVRRGGRPEQVVPAGQRASLRGPGRPDHGVEAARAEQAGQEAQRAGPGGRRQQAGHRAGRLGQGGGQALARRRRLTGGGPQAELAPGPLPAVVTAGQGHGDVERRVGRGSGTGRTPPARWCPTPPSRPPRRSPRRACRGARRRSRRPLSAPAGPRRPARRRPHRARPRRRWPRPAARRPGPG